MSRLLLARLRGARTGVARWMLPQAACLLLVAAPGAKAAASAEAAPEAPRVQVAFAPRRGQPAVHYALRLATSPAAQARGLMYVRQLAASDGMLFAFDDVRPRAFWMKNTFVPLDLLFVDAGCQVVEICANARPHDLSPQGGTRPTRYVVELLAGQAKRQDIRVGDGVLFSLPGHACPPRGPRRHAGGRASARTP